MPDPTRITLDTCHLEITCPEQWSRADRDRALVEAQPHLQRFLDQLAEALREHVARGLRVATDHDAERL
jgi:hypothetical protein